MNKLYIPKKCKVGFQERANTYTNKLGYIIYHDNKKWRKEPSWKNWITNYMEDEQFLLLKQEIFDKQVIAIKNSYKHTVENKNQMAYYTEILERFPTLESYLIYNNVDKIENFPNKLKNTTNDKSFIPIEFNNEPIEGFVLNKKAGGNTSHWNTRATYCRIYDPRGWEFEITIDNLLYILENTNCIKGKGLVGKFIYSWDETNLILLPEHAPEYKEMVQYTELQSLKVSKKDLKVGYNYIMSNGKEYTFMGEHLSYNYANVPQGKKFWFMGKCKDIYKPTINNIKKETVKNENYPQLWEKLQSIPEFKPTKQVKFEILNETTLKKDILPLAYSRGAKIKNYYVKKAENSYTKRSFYFEKNNSNEIICTIHNKSYKLQELLTKYTLYKLSNNAQ